MANEEKPWVDNYLSGGRRFKNLDAPALKQEWFAAVNCAQHARDSGYDAELNSALRTMDDIEAEFNLRGLEAPGPRRH
jgi:DNA topoisomerase IB